MRHVMVELDAFCYNRGVALTYIDMRWGMMRGVLINYYKLIEFIYIRDRNRDDESDHSAMLARSGPLETLFCGNHCTAIWVASRNRWCR
jgi:hypothetical protein